MSELFLRVVNMSISASWLIAAVLVVRFAFKRAPKWLNVLLWGIVGVRLLCPFSIESALSLIPSAETIPQQVLTGPSFDIQTGIPQVDNRVNDYLGDRYYEGVTIPADNGGSIMAVLAVVWLVGIALVLLYTAVSYWRLHRRVRTAFLLRDNLFQSEAISSPFVLGIIRPRIYLPVKLAERDMEHVIAHETAHIHRRDHWWKPLSFLLLTIHWFNPLMWLGYVLLCRDIELACDEKVIAKLGNEERADYTQALVSCSMDRRMIAACPLAFGEVGVKERVRSVLNYKKPAFWIILLSVLVCAAVAVCFLTDPEEGPDFGKVVSVSVGNDETPVSDEGTARLIELLERYRKSDFTVGWDDPNLDSVPVYIVFSDGSHCLLHYYYYNGFSLEKLLDGEGSYYAVLTCWASDGSVDAWKMEEDFNEEFERWYGEYYANIPVTNPDPMDESDPEDGEDLEIDADPEAEKLYDRNEAISAAILGHYGSDEPDGLIRVTSYKFFSNEMMSGTPTYQGGDPIMQETVYLTAYYAEYSVQNSELTLVTASCIPTAITFTIGEDGAYILKDYWAAPDGELHAAALYSKFPVWIVEDVFALDYMEELIAECEQKAMAVLNAANGNDSSDDTAGNVRISFFTDIMGCDGYIISESMGLWSSRSYYAVVDGRQWLLAESFGFGEADDYAIDFNGDGVTELVTNVQYGGDGAARVYVYQRKSDTIYMGTFSTAGLLNFDNWGANATWSEYNSEEGKFILHFAQKGGDEYGVIRTPNPWSFEFLEYSTLAGDTHMDAAHSTTEINIEYLLSQIESSPAHSSNPSDYIAEHRAEFDGLVDYGVYALHYCFSEFLEGGQDGLRGHIMAAACREISEEWGEALLTAESSPITGQRWFDIIKANALRLAEQYSVDELEAMYPASYLLLIMMGK